MCAAWGVLCEFVCEFVFVFGGVCVVYVLCIHTGVCFVCHLLCDAVSVKCALCVCACVCYTNVCVVRVMYCAVL